MIPVVCPHSNNGSLNSNEYISFNETLGLLSVCPVIETLLGAFKFFVLLSIPQCHVI